MKQKFILLDIDNTLYDTSSFRKKLFEQVVLLLEKHNVTNATELCETIHSDIMKEKGLFYPEDFVTTLSKRLGMLSIPEKELLDAMYDEKHVSSYLYQETEALVETFKNIGELGIFSQGMDRFQRLKIQRISHMFKDEHIHIVTNKIEQMGNIFEKYQSYELFFLDDALPVLHAVKKKYPYVYTIWIKRGRHANKQGPIPGFTPDATALTLEQAERMIQKN